MDRKEYLLRVCLELLQRAEDSSHVLDVISETFHYDEADCDGYCLMEDIKIELNID